MKRLCGLSVLCGIITIMTCVPVSAFPDKDKPSPVASSEANAKVGAYGSSPLSGKVVETMNSGGYTYVLLEKKGKKTWVAMPEMKVSVGQQMSLHPGQEMLNFRSPSLGRTFSSIIFSGGPVSEAKSAAGMEKSGGKNAGNTAAISPGGKNIKVVKAAGPDAYTVAEIYEKRAALHEKTAVIRGKVVKVSAGIMGKNWIHLQDGTGDAGKGTNNLVTTSQELPAVGDVVTMKGTIYLDKDFGSGYKYAVIMEKAVMQR